jgi:polyvinyl alcohol dehydrogenase (cytochrome)
MVRATLSNVTFFVSVAAVCACTGGGNEREARSDRSALRTGAALAGAEGLGPEADGAPPPSGANGRHGWPLAGFDAAGTGHNPRERRLRPSNVAGLAVDWTFEASGAGMPVRPIHATPVVDRQGNVYVGDFGGTFFAISPTGARIWSFSSDPPTPELGALIPPAIGPPTASPFLGGAALAGNRPYVVAGDANGRIYARDTRTGAEVWTARGLDPNPLGGVAGNSISVIGDTVLVGLGSLENYAFVLSAGGIRVDCCAHRGALVALALDTGEERWRYNLVDQAALLPPSAAPFLLGPSGADVWSQPTYDRATGTVYVSTGQNLSPTAEGRSTATSDAMAALDFQTGALRWIRQLTQDDIWAVGVPNPNPATGQPVDMDLGDAPKIYRLRDGRKVVGAGQKDGRYHVLDAATGELVRSTQVIAPRNDLGGFQTGGAFAGGTVFQHGLHATDGFTDCNEGACLYEGFEGRVVALSEDGAQVRWSLAIPSSPLVGGLAVANGLVYFQSLVEEAVPGSDPPQWALYAVDAADGGVRLRLTFPGRAIGSPAVADGHVYVTNGNVALGAYGIVPEGALMRLGLPDQDR